MKIIPKYGIGFPHYLVNIFRVNIFKKISVSAIFILRIHCIVTSISVYYGMFFIPHLIVSETSFAYLFTTEEVTDRCDTHDIS
jgi:hypothetical protein